MNKRYKKRVQEPYNEVWDILKTIRDDDSDEAWDLFRTKIDDFYKRRLEHIPGKRSKDYIRCEKEYLTSLYTALLHMGDMAAYILEHEENEE